MLFFIARNAVLVISGLAAVLSVLIPMLLARRSSTTVAAPLAAGPPPPTSSFVWSGPSSPAPTPGGVTNGTDSRFGGGAPEARPAGGDPYGFFAASPTPSAFGATPGPTAAGAFATPPPATPSFSALAQFGTAPEGAAHMGAVPAALAPAYASPPPKPPWRPSTVIRLVVGSAAFLFGAVHLAHLGTTWIGFDLPDQVAGSTRIDDPFVDSLLDAGKDQIGADSTIYNLEAAAYRDTSGGIYLLMGGVDPNGTRNFDSEWATLQDSLDNKTAQPVNVYDEDAGSGDKLRCLEASESDGQADLCIITNDMTFFAVWYSAETGGSGAAFLRALVS